MGDIKWDIPNKYPRDFWGKVYTRGWLIIMVPSQWYPNFPFESCCPPSFAFPFRIGGDLEWLQPEDDSEVTDYLVYLAQAVSPKSPWPSMAFSAKMKKKTLKTPDWLDFFWSLEEVVWFSNHPNWQYKPCMWFWCFKDLGLDDENSSRRTALDEIAPFWAM